MRVDDFFQEIENELPEIAEVAEEVDAPFILARNVYRLRTQQNLTQGELAERAGMRQPRIAEIERGDANPQLDTLAKLARGLGVAADSLIADAQPADHDSHRVVLTTKVFADAGATGTTGLGVWIPNAQARGRSETVNELFSLMA